MTYPAKPGIGIDIVDIDQFENAMQREGFREKVFSPAEIEICEGKPDPLASYAARFAVKEAFFKALGDPGMKAVPWTQIETLVENDTPALQLTPALEARMMGRFPFISLTHSHKIAAAVVLLLPANIPSPPELN
ncbi:holo-ACP synthase [bacterium]|nr:holo-ACP synthase [bacterium]MBU1652096.1 holo-ACP synthase [bacterium]MBU1882451.1 holo-ACP synthase [bacterium]